MTVQKRLASEILKCSPKKIVFDTDSLEEIKEAITKEDIKGLIRQKIIKKKHHNNTSRSRARKIHIQKTKGRRKGLGSRKGKATARLKPKLSWMNRVRVQRKLLKILRGKGVINTKLYRDLYLKSKGGFFRSKRHIKMYMHERGIKK